MQPQCKSSLERNTFKHLLKKSKENHDQLQMLLNEVTIKKTIWDKTHPNKNLENKENKENNKK